MLATNEKLGRVHSLIHPIENIVLVSAHYKYPWRQENFTNIPSLFLMVLFNS